MKRLIALLCLGLFVLAGCSSKDQELAEQVRLYRAAKLEQYQAENEQFADFEVDVAFLGDSLTDGYPLEKFYPQYTVSNRGIGGDTTTGLLERLQVSLYDLKPKVAVMLIGANNMDKMFADYETILAGFRQNTPSTKIILLSLTSMSGEWGKKNQLAAYNNVRIKLLADKYGYEFVDLFTPLMDVSTGQIRPEYTTDGGHLTELGYEVLTAQITPAIEKQLAAWHAEKE